MDMHPADDLRSTSSNRLKDKLIVLGITGSIAAVECVKLARELIRNGARVKAVLTTEAAGIIHPNAMHFSTGEAPVTEITGEVEHVSLCGDVPDRADLLLIAPCTANTLGKIVNGIDDTPVSTFATTAIGTGIPVMIVPAMHGTMYDNPTVKENLASAGSLGMEIVGPRHEEKKAKMAGQEEIVERVMRRIGPGRLSGRRVLILAGSTRERIDDFRVITNRATGKSGMALAREAFREGADVLIMAGEGADPAPEYMNCSTFSDVKELLKRIKTLGGEWGYPDIAFFTAAISDYTPVPLEGKMGSDQDVINIELKRNPKIIERFRKLYPDTFLVGYKAESRVDDQLLMKRAYKRMTEVGMDLVVANNLQEVMEGESKVLLISPSKEVFEIEGGKDKIAGYIIDRTISIMRASRPKESG